MLGNLALKDVVFDVLGLGSHLFVLVHLSLEDFGLLVDVRLRNVLLVDVSRSEGGQVQAAVVGELLYGVGCRSLYDYGAGCLEVRVNVCLGNSVVGNVDYVYFGDSHVFASLCGQVKQNVLVGLLNLCVAVGESDVQKLFAGGDEVRVVGDKVSFASNFDKGDLLVLCADKNAALGCGSLGALGDGGQSFFLKNLFSFFGVSVGFSQGFLAVHKTGACGFAQSFYVRCFNFHNNISF